MNRWAGKVAVVTGVSSGIGESIARHLTAKGMKVLGLARRVDRLKKVEEELKSSKGEFKGLQCDVSDVNQVKSAFLWVEQNWGAVSVLVNNAAVLNLEILTDSNVEKIKQMFDTNIVGVSYCFAEAIKSMKKHDNEGCIININSVAGHMMPPMPGFGGYTSTKYALTALTEFQRSEVSLFSTKIRVTSLSPGLVDTEMTAPFVGKFPAGIHGLKGTDIANCVEFVLSTPVSVNISELTVQPTSETMMKFVGGPK